MIKPLKVIHFVTGGFSGATYVVADIIAEQKEKENIENLLVLRKKKNTDDAKLNLLTSQGINYKTITNKTHWASIQQLREIIDEFQPDVLFAHGFPEHLIGRWAAKNRVPTLFQVEHNSNERYSWWKLWQSRHLSQYTTQAIGVSSSVSNTLKQQNLNCPITTITNGVNIKKFYNKTPLINRPKDIIMVARFAKNKHQKIVIEAIAKLAQQNIKAKVIFLGTGNKRYRKNAERQAEELGVLSQIDFLGHRTNVAELLAEHKIFILASFAEGLSLSVIEAMSAGCVVLGSDIGGIQELIEHKKDGFLFSNNDSHQLSEYLSVILKNPNAYQKMTQLAQQKAKENYDVSVMAENYYQLCINTSKAGIKQ